MTITIQNIIDRILQDIPGGPLAETVDTFKSGDPSQSVTSIVTTFCASVDVIRKAAELGANLIITHEPTFYHHEDDQEWVQETPAYQAKRQLLDEHNIVVWRFHDHWHHHRPDGIITGVIRQLGWEAYPVAADKPLYHLPAQTLGALIADVKAKLDIQSVRVIGDMAMVCEHVAFLPGAPPGQWQTLALADAGVDVVLAGEVREWEVTEYARDAVALGQKKALVVLGHAQSEEGGMAYLVEWLGERFPDVAVTHIPVGEPFTFSGSLGFRGERPYLGG